MPLTPIAELQTIIQTHIANRPLALDSQTLPLAQAAGRVLAEDIIAPVSIPSSNVSAMDGYALAQATPAQSSLKIVGESAAGNAFSDSLKAGYCASNASNSRYRRSYSLSGTVGASSV